MSGIRTSALVVAAMLVLAPAASAEEAPEVEGKVALGGLVTGARPGLLPGGAFDARTMLELRLLADNLGRKPVGVRLDGDLFFDLDDREFRTYRVLDLNLHMAPGDGPVTLTLGRQRVADTTEELADGLGVRAALGKGVYAGGYGGLIPEPFSTLLSWQTGGAGVVLGYQGGRFRAELASGFSVRSTGLDRGFVHLSAMGTPVRALTFFGRIKAQNTHASPAMGLADLFAGVTVRPVRIVRLRASYNAYSSERYVDLVDRDPTLSHFAHRADALSLLDEIPNDELDPTLFHGAGVDADLFDAPHHLAFGARGRFRFAPEPDDGYLLVEGHGGPVALGHGHGLIRAAGRYIRAGGRPMGQAEVGAEIPMFEQRLALGVYALYSGSPALEGEDRATQGVYGDLFADVWLGKGWSVAAAFRLGWEDTPSASEITVDGLLKIANRFHKVGGGKPETHGLRPPRRDPRLGHAWAE